MWQMTKRALLGWWMLTGAMLVNAPDEADACTCLPTTIESSYHRATDVASVDIWLRFGFGGTRWYLGSIEHVYKGCNDAGELVLLETASTGAECGANFELGERYLVNGYADGQLLGIPRLRTNLCAGNLAQDALGEDEREFLASRMVCCGDECACADGSDPVQCLVDPCEVAPECPEGECVANYCGGCRAEFYDDAGNAVCQPESQCESDGDCDDGQWCRRADPADQADPALVVMECVPFVGEGERCNGFTLPWAYERCAEELTCDTPDRIADAPGICARSCDEADDCSARQYCASDGLCAPEGSCEAVADCSLPGNDYPRPACVGFAVCDELANACGWECASVDAGAGSPNADAGGAGTDAGSAGDAQDPGPPEPAPECLSNADCVVSGCSGQVCAAEPMATTCEWRPEYACYDDAYTSCGCFEGRCGWESTDALAECLEEAGGGS